MADILPNLVRIGTVSAVDTNRRRARVIFPDMDIVSGWLYVLQMPGAVVNMENAGRHTHVDGASLTTSEDGEHKHTATVGSWMPKVNDKVVVLYLPVFNSDGFVLGVI